MLAAYPKIRTVGDRHVENIFDGPVDIQEKVDGSQFSFGLFDGVLLFSSKRVGFGIDNVPKLFTNACAHIDARKELLTPGWTYTCEYLSRPKHNVLQYSRTPTGFLILFDVRSQEGPFASQATLPFIAHQLGIEPVPLIYSGDCTVKELSQHLDTESVLGGTKVEGVVIKRYTDMATGLIVAKLVSDKFKEKAGARIKTPRLPDAINELVAQLGAQYCTEARWQKCVQHLRDDGALAGVMEDIPSLLRELHKDLWDEGGEYIAATVMQRVRKEITRRVSQGFPQWYKSQLIQGVTDGHE
ncbi:MAG: RNA ligase family protein [Candidatus Binatia bacterium]|nr:RNA ligase family protein [Candidatus Binatia bacterium]